MNTKLLYLEDFYLLESKGSVLSVSQEDGRDIVVLDQTVFYPQGGGQPYDTGTITSAGASLRVEEVRFVDGIVKHVGKFVESGIFTPGEEVTCMVDAERRKLHSRLHSGGHVVDLAMSTIRPDWVPGKGFHFPDGPYVEYAGTLTDQEKESLKAEVEKRCNELVQENRATKLVFMEKEKMHEVCRHVPDYLPEGKPARVVMYGDFGVPCGGTHVGTLSEIGKITIRKIKNKDGNIRVGYNVEMT